MKRYMIEEARQALALSGRLEQTLDRLIAAGSKGLTAGELEPGLRLAAYIEKLRKLFRELFGIHEAIQTKRERTAGGANIGRYILVTKVRRIYGNGDD